MERTIGLVAATLVIISCALPWLVGGGLPSGSGLDTASRLWAVGDTFSGTLQTAAVIWVLVPLGGTVLWGLRWVTREWTWPSSLAAGLVTLGLAIAVAVTVSGASGGRPAAGLWLAIAGAAVSVALDALHLLRRLGAAAP